MNKQKLFTVQYSNEVPKEHRLYTLEEHPLRKVIPIDCVEIVDEKMEVYLTPGWSKRTEYGITLISDSMNRIRLKVLITVDTFVRWEIVPYFKLHEIIFESTPRMGQLTSIVVYDGNHRVVKQSEFSMDYRYLSKQIRTWMDTHYQDWADPFAYWTAEVPSKTPTILP